MIEGTAALAAVEAAGIRIDVPYLDKALAETQVRIRDMETKLRECEEYKLQRRRYGDKTNIGSRPQLGHILFDVMGLEGAVHAPSSTKERPRYIVDEAVLQAVGTPYCTSLLELEKFKKIEGTYLRGVRRETVDGICHPTFPLYKVITFRGAAADPNLQNIPIRDPVLGELIRRAFIPRDGHVLLECDLKANEVRVATCYHKDPTMIAYIEQDYDLHTDMARECYILPATATKKTDGFGALRNLAKGNFVFAEFYGSYYVDVARALWDEAENLKIQGKSVQQHLREQGITCRGECVKGDRRDPLPDSFERHIQQIEKRFWGERFPVYDRWRRDWWDRYQKLGWFQMLTGFTVCWGLGGPLKRNDCINSPVQGSAFHCLLWGLIQLNRWLRKNKMRSVIVAQIHDSILVDAHESEWQEVAAKIKQLLVHDIREHYRWLIVPLGVEASVSRTNWWEKKEVQI